MTDPISDERIAAIKAGLAAGLGISIPETSALIERMEKAEKAQAALIEERDYAVERYAAAVDDAKNHRAKSEERRISITRYMSVDVSAHYGAVVAERDAAIARVKALEEALEPDGDTKAAYMGEFSFPVQMINEDGEEQEYKQYVPWTTIKEIMTAIRARAALEGK